MMHHHRTGSSSDSNAASLHKSPSPWKKLKKGSQKWLLNIGLLLQQEELAANGDLSEDEDAVTAQERALSKLGIHLSLSTDHLHHYAPGLKQLLNNCKKKDTLCEIITEANDATHLKVHVRVYAVLHPLKAGLEPPLSTTGTRSVFGLNHPFLMKLLCPSSAWKDCASNPECIHSSARTCQELLEGKIAMTTNDLPLFLWSEDTLGCNIDDDNKYKDLFQGPLTALGKVSRSTHPPNAILHQMTTVKAEHIAYGCLQVCFAISSWTKWAEMDGTFNYCSFYYNIVDMIQESPDKEWVEWLKKWWNVSLFKSEMGCEAGAGAMELRQDSDDVISSTSNNSLSQIQAQMAAHVARHTGPPDGSSSSSHGPLPPADPSLQSSCPSASCRLDIPPSESHPHPPSESHPHSPLELPPFQPLQLHVESLTHIQEYMTKLQNQDCH
ncbi:hypothetical protein EDC04DRAFT_2602713 [Pisolithus marmoratus]|nr:hypothetical protein EDC04DRAFT_2602713 [Pisolithus marmoratus]